MEQGKGNESALSLRLQQESTRTDFISLRLTGNMLVQWPLLKLQLNLLQLN